MVLIVRNSPEYQAESDPPPCPSVKINDTYLVKRGLVSYDAFGSLLKRQNGAV